MYNKQLEDRAMSNNSVTPNRAHIAFDRILSLVRDGYYIRVKSVGDNLLFWKLLHRTNRNCITITVIPSLDKMIQKSNGKVVYYGKIQA